MHMAVNMVGARHWWGVFSNYGPSSSMAASAWRLVAAYPVYVYFS